MIKTTTTKQQQQQNLFLVKNIIETLNHNLPDYHGCALTTNGLLKQLVESIHKGVN